MISEVKSTVPMIQKAIRKPKSKAALAGIGALTVLSTGQAWPHCNGILGHDMPIRETKSDVPEIDIDDKVDLPSISEFFKHPIDGVTDTAAYTIDAACNAINKVKDFLESFT